MPTDDDLINTQGGYHPSKIQINYRYEILT